MIRLLWCADPLAGFRVDPAYAAEAAAAEALGLACDLLDFESLVDHADVARAIRRVAVQSEPVSAVYRGWMLRSQHYAALYAALRERGMTLLADPAAYRHCHELPEWYPSFADATPRSVWLAADESLDQIMDVLHVFGSAPVILKDFVKSRKHEWDSACFIPSAADRDAVERVVQRFLALQGADLVGGLVFREFVPLEPIGQHPHSGMPLTREFRLVFAAHRPIAAFPYWDEVAYGAAELPIDHFTRLAERVPSPLFTMDVARHVDGHWLLIELGDGQVAGLPESANLPAFYAALYTALVP